MKFSASTGAEERVVLDLAYGDTAARFGAGDQSADHEACGLLGNEGRRWLIAVVAAARGEAHESTEAAYWLAEVLLEQATALAGQVAQVLLRYGLVAAGDARERQAGDLMETLVDGRCSGCVGK